MPLTSPAVRTVGRSVLFADNFAMQAEVRSTMCALAARPRLPH
jgi:hypothetical protein